MRKFMGGLAAAMLLVVPSFAGDGPAVDESMPMLQVDAFNDGDAGKYCITCKAGMKPTVVAFVKEDNEATRALIAAVNEQAEARKDAKLAAVVVIVGEGDAANALKSYVESEGFKVPTAIVAPSKALEKWQLNDEASNTVVLGKEHTVKSVVANAAAADLGGQVDGLVG